MSPQMVRCPHCKAVDSASELLDDWNGSTYRCMRCGDRFHLGEADNWIDAAAEHPETEGAEQ